MDRIKNIGGWLVAAIAIPLLFFIWAERISEQSEAKATLDRARIEANAAIERALTTETRAVAEAKAADERSKLSEEQQIAAMQATDIALAVAEGSQNQARIAQDQLNAVAVATYVDYVARLVEACENVANLQRGLVDSAIDSLLSRDFEAARTSAELAQNRLPARCTGEISEISILGDFIDSGQLFEHAFSSSAGG